MQKFGNTNQLMGLLNTATQTVGWGNFTKALGFFKKFDTQNIISNMLTGTIDKVNEEHNRLYDSTDSLGIPNDVCYGIRAIYGMVAEKGKNLSGHLNISIRCSTFEKLYESLQKFTSGIWIDVPLRRSEKSREMLINDLHAAASKLEKITGNNVTDNSLRKTCLVTNECKQYSRKIIHEIALSDIYPCQPVTLSQFLILIEISFMDYLSNAEKFRDLLKEIYFEMKQRQINSEYAIDVSSKPKVLLTPRFGGSDSAAHEYIYENGGRMIYADWELLRYTDEIKSTGNMFENYADYLMGTIQGFGVNNEENTNNIVKFAIDNNIDGVVYNQLFGCHSLTTGYKMLRKKLRKEGISSTIISFNRIGDNRGQLKTRLDALMEVLL